MGQSTKRGSSPKSPRHRSRINHAIRQEGSDLVRGICGGFLFGIPLLYTMEVWWIGSAASPPRLIGALVITLLVCYLLSRTEGFRTFTPGNEYEAFRDAIEAVAIGLLCTAIALFILRQLTVDTQLSESLGKVVFESVPFALGVSIANELLGNRDLPDREAASNQPNSREQTNLNTDDRSSPRLSGRFFPDNNLNETLSDAAATAVGATIIALSIAPTDEVPVLVAAIDGPWLILTILISLLLSYSIVFQANFTHQGQRRLQRGLFQSPLSETFFSYLVSLVAAVLMLGFFQQIDFTTPWELAFREMVVLGLPATIGGAAGRLAL